MIGKAIFALLNNTTNAGVRVYPSVIPQGITQDSIRYTLVSTNINRTLKSSENTKESLIQIDCFSKKNDLVETLAQQVRDIMEGYSGTVAGIAIDKILISDAGRSYFDDEFQEFNINIDIRCWWV